MSSFAGPSYLTVRSSVCITLIWDSCIFNLYILCKTGSSYIRREPQQYALHFNEWTIQTLSSVRPVPVQVIILSKGPPKLCIECHLVPLWEFPPKSPGIIPQRVYLLSVCTFSTNHVANADNLISGNKRLPRRSCWVCFPSIFRMKQSIQKKMTWV